MSEDFCSVLRSRWPEMYNGAYDVWVGPGWQPIVITLSDAIQSYIVRRNNFHEKNPNKVEKVEQVTVSQIKEKFGGFRFYYDGGDSYIDGLVDMAERWADHTCEDCGQPGHNRTDLSWHKTLCDVHYAIRKHGKDE